ncbi:hypothetical protein KPSA1_02162 [Pseudomonas syringae pv. actinidiae]|uniref:Uncharacterized protein n=1 Tax=Pseudomonas syringae pv. actinidiae TaxID=103796 RepID=A0A2V0Q7Y5_PSESF|nr:hypothetical protein KPSA1_02162 [Pseudomonas syringae pv. actinidiae]
MRFSRDSSQRLQILSLMAVDVVDCCLNGRDLFRFFVRDFGLEFLFQSHYQLNGVQGVSAQVFNERSSVDNLF